MAKKALVGKTTDKQKKFYTQQRIDAEKKGDTKTLRSIEKKAPGSTSVGDLDRLSAMKKKNAAKKSGSSSKSTAKAASSKSSSSKSSSKSDDSTAFTPGSGPDKIVRGVRNEFANFKKNV